MKTSGAGTLTLNGNVEAAPKASVREQTNLEALNQVTVTDSRGRTQTLYIGSESLVKEPMAMFELPPASPEFDVRYASGRMVETYPSKLEAKGVYQYPINITAEAEAYPLTVQWNVVKKADRAIVLTSPDGKTLGNTIMEGSGVVHIRDAGVNALMLTLRDVEGVPKIFSLGQNYPNPFNPTTHFNIAIPRTAEVTIMVYDVLGRTVRTLLSGQQSTGYQTVEWDSKDAHGLSVPTGIYFVRMNADEFSATSKIMLMK